MSYKQLFRTFAGNEERRMQEIGFVVFPRFQVMGLSAITAFEVANLVLEKPAYAVTLLSETGGLVPTSAGFSARRSHTTAVAFALALAVA